MASFLDIDRRPSELLAGIHGFLQIEGLADAVSDKPVRAVIIAPSTEPVPLRHRQLLSSMFAGEFAIYERDYWL